VRFKAPGHPGWPRARASLQSPAHKREKRPGRALRAAEACTRARRASPFEAHAGLVFPGAGAAPQPAARGPPSRWPPLPNGAAAAPAVADARGADVSMIARSQSSPGLDGPAGRRARALAVGSIPEHGAVEPRALSVSEVLRPVRKVRSPLILYTTLPLPYK